MPVFYRVENIEISVSFVVTGALGRLEAFVACIGLLHEAGGQ